MIYVGENKSILCKGNFRPAQLYKGDKKITGYTVEEFEGTGSVTLEDCYNDKLHNAVIHGNSVQDGTPTPEAPIEVQSVGEKVTEGDYAGKYKVSVRAKCIEDTSQIEEFNIYLDAPLRKIGNYEDYIDFEKGVVVRNVEKKVFDGTETWNSVTGKFFCYLGKTSGCSVSVIGCLSNYFKAYTWGVIWKNGEKTEGNRVIGVALQDDGSGHNVIQMTPYQTIPTVNEWKAQLQ